MRARIGLAIVAALATVGTSSGKDARIGNATLVLPPPSGYCELDDKQPSDGRMIRAISQLLAGQNELLAVSAECRQLQDWRAGRRPVLDDYAQYQTLLRSKDSNLPRAESVKQFCTAMRAQGEALTPGVMSDVRSRAEAVLKDVKFNETRFVGVLAEDANACYFALLQKLKTEAGTEKTQMTLAGVTIIKGKIVYYYTYTVYVSADTVTAALARHQANVAALLAANGG